MRQLQKVRMPRAMSIAGAVAVRTLPRRRRSVGVVMPGLVPGIQQPRAPEQAA